MAQQQTKYGVAAAVKMLCVILGVSTISYSYPPHGVSCYPDFVCAAVSVFPLYVEITVQSRVWLVVYLAGSGAAPGGCAFLAVSHCAGLQVGA